MLLFYRRFNDLINIEGAWLFYPAEARKEKYNPYWRSSKDRQSLIISSG